MLKLDKKFKAQTHLLSHKKMTNTWWCVLQKCPRQNKCTTTRGQQNRVCSHYRISFQNGRQIMATTRLFLIFKITALARLSKPTKQKRHGFCSATMA